MQLWSFCEEKSVQLVRVAFFRSNFLQNLYFSDVVRISVVINVTHHFKNFLFSTFGEKTQPQTSRDNFKIPITLINSRQEINIEIDLHSTACTV